MLFLMPIIVSWQTILTTYKKNRHMKVTHLNKFYLSDYTFNINFTMGPYWTLSITLRMVEYLVLSESKHSVWEKLYNGVCCNKN